MQNKFAAAYFLDKDNFNYTLTSALSVLENNKNIDIILMFDQKPENSVVGAFSTLKTKYETNIAFFEIKKEFLSNFSGLGCYNFDSIYPFLLPEHFNYDRILFLSSYTIVNGSLSELFDIDFANNYIMAPDSFILSHGYLKQTGFTFEDYYESSSILVDTKKINENGILNQLLASVNEIKDLNLVTREFFKNKRGRLDFKYNYIEKPLINFNKNANNSKEYKKAKKHPIIINFKETRPQNANNMHSMREIWWNYAKLCPVKIEEEQCYKLSATEVNNSFNYAWLLNRIFPYIKPYMGRIIAGFLIALPLGLLDGVTALALKPYMDFVVGQKSYELSFLGNNFSITPSVIACLIPFGIVLFAGLQGVLRYLNEYITTWISQKITNDVKLDLYHKLINMHTGFYDINSSGIIISRYINDPQTASSGIVSNLQTLITSACGAIGLICVMLYSSWQLAFIGVIVLTIAFVPVILIRKRIKDASNKNMVIGGNITTNINETYSGNKVVSAYSLEDKMEKYFTSQVLRSFDVNMSLVKRAAWMSPLMYLIASFGIAIVLGYGTYLINSGLMTAGSFASFVTSLLLLYKPVKTLGNTLTGMQTIFVSLGRIFELFDLTSNIKEDPAPVELFGLKDKIEFQNVVFEYVKDKPVLHNFNLTVKKGETIALVGNSGGGKSTVVNLIPRFYDIVSGAILIDGIDIKKYSLKCLRKNISMVFQDNFLFTGTIRENIMMGNYNASPEELNKAVTSAHLDDFVYNLPSGLDTVIGERGMTLSGGQRQRIAIARAILKNAPIVILDEATSALDNQSEAVVQKAMDNLMKDKTVFIIAHRLSTIKNADRIAVINGGYIVETGGHDELMNIEGGEYRTLYEMQFRNSQEALV